MGNGVSGCAGERASRNRYNPHDRAVHNVPRGFVQRMRLDGQLDLEDNLHRDHGVPHCKLYSHASSVGTGIFHRAQHSDGAVIGQAKYTYISYERR